MGVSFAADQQRAARQIHRSLKAWRAEDEEGGKPGSDEELASDSKSAQPPAEQSINAKLQRLARKSDANDGGDTKVFLARPTRDPATPRADQRPVANSVATQQGVDIQIQPGALNHVLSGHTVENFDPVSRLGEVAPGTATSLFPPGFATNPQEIVTVVKQALGNKAGRTFEPAARRLDVELKGVKLQIWVGPIGAANPGAFKLNSVFPSGGVQVSFADLQKFANEIKSGTKTLQQIRTELVGRFRK